MGKLLAVLIMRLIPWNSMTFRTKSSWVIIREQVNKGNFVSVYYRLSEWRQGVRLSALGILLAGAEPGRGLKPNITSGKLAQQTASTPGNRSFEDSFLEWVMETPTKEQ